MTEPHPLVSDAAALTECLARLLAHPRVRYLAARSKAGTLTPSEEAELDRVRQTLDSYGPIVAALRFAAADDEGAAVRRLLGAHPEGRA